MRKHGGQQQHPGSNSGLLLYEQSDANPLALGLALGLGSGIGSSGLDTRLREGRFFLVVSLIS